jgi:hypothetical protein
MGLEAAASIIKIFAAAGKIAETLGPVVSTFQDVTKHTASVLSEVNSSRIILAALQKYLADLSLSPRLRRGLIQVEQLVVTLTDGFLLFSELEELVLRLTDTDLNRIRWAMNDHKFTTLIARMQCFKNTIIVMLNILQWFVLFSLNKFEIDLLSESDMEAHQSRQELITLTVSLLQNNESLARRLSHLEDCFDKNLSTIPRRPDSIAPVTNPAHAGSSSRVQETNDALSILLFGTSGELPFEKILLSSKVYHNAQQHTCDVSFRSSIGLSHAWTALSEISLSDISAISVVALPIYLDDISNSQHYVFGDRGVGLQSFAQPSLAQTSEMSICTEDTPFKQPNEVTVVVKGSHIEFPLEIVEKVWHPHYEQRLFKVSTTEVCRLRRPMQEPRNHRVCYHLQQIE